MRWLLFICATALLGGGALFWLMRSPTLPAVAQAGTGPLVTLVLFSDQGERLQTVALGKVVQSDAAWRRQLTGEQYAVARQKSTEYPFHNLYWNNHASGIYRCVCCGNAVFSSRQKFDSDTGWPSFYAPIAPENILTLLFKLGRAALCSKQVRRRAAQFASFGGIQELVDGFERAEEAGETGA